MLVIFTYSNILPTKSSLSSSVSNATESLISNITIGVYSLFPILYKSYPSKSSSAFSKYNIVYGPSLFYPIIFCDFLIFFQLLPQSILVIDFHANTHSNNHIWVNTFSSSTIITFPLAKSLSFTINY